MTIATAVSASPNETVERAQIRALMRGFSLEATRPTAIEITWRSFCTRMSDAGSSTPPVITCVPPLM